MIDLYLFEIIYFYTSFEIDIKKYTIHMLRVIHLDNIMFKIIHLLIYIWQQIIYYYLHMLRNER
jgi:hypothetical protein